MHLCFCSIAFQRDKWGAQRVIERAIETILPLLPAAGYDGVELWYTHIEKHDAGQRTALVTQLRQLRLTVPMLSSYYDFTGSAQLARDSLAHGREVLTVARELGVGAVRIFTGKVGSAEANAEQWQWTVDALQELADEAGRWGINLAAETHPRNLMDTVPASLELVTRVNRPNFGLIYQPSTFRTDYLGALAQLWPHVLHVHATNMGADGKGTALAEGEMKYPEILGQLRRYGFQGYLSVEWMGAEPELVVQREGAYLRRLLDAGTV
jgi:3-dehydroshikimate dehydratase